MNEHAVDIPDRTADILGPFGTGNINNVAIHNGKCPIDSDFFNKKDIDVISKCALSSFDKYL